MEKEFAVKMRVAVLPHFWYYSLFPNFSLGQQSARVDSTESEDDGITKVSHYGFPDSAIDKQGQQDS